MIRRYVLLGAAVIFAAAACGAEAAPDADAGSVSTASAVVSAPGVPAPPTASEPDESPHESYDDHRPAEQDESGPTETEPTEADSGVENDTTPTTESGAEVNTPTTEAAPVRPPVPVDLTIPPASVGEVPSTIMTSILADLASRTTGEPVTSQEVTRAEAVVWSDGSLGCPAPGVAYTQAQVHGYLVVISHNSSPYEYHASSDGRVILCQRFRSNPSP